MAENRNLPRHFSDSSTFLEWWGRLRVEIPGRKVTVTFWQCALGDVTALSNWSLFNRRFLVGVNSLETLYVLEMWRFFHRYDRRCFPREWGLHSLQIGCGMTAQFRFV